MLDKLKAIYEKIKAAPQWVLILAVGLAFGYLFGAGCIGCRVGPFGTDISQYSFGWENRPEHVQSVVGTFKNPFFGDAAKPLIQGDTDKDAFLWIAFEKVTGKPWVPHDQDGVGSCVGHGWSGAVELLTCVEITINGEAQEYKPISAASIYAFSRELGNFLGNQDGSTGADAAKAVMTLGSLSCEDAKDDNQDIKIGSALCKKWGRTGVPSGLRESALSHKVKTASMVRTPEEVRAALVNGYVVPVASSVGFEGRGGFKRDSKGFCYPGGTWPHQMFIGGYRKEDKAFLVFQSWGRNMPPGPKSSGQPDGTFWITWEACQRIVRTGECYAISSFDGYKARDLDWFIMANQKRYLAWTGGRNGLREDRLGWPAGRH